MLGSQDVWGEPVERCMLCFKDFPLSVLVEHSWKCTGDLLGSAKRFKSFLPSVHDVSKSLIIKFSETPHEVASLTRSLFQNGMFIRQ